MTDDAAKSHDAVTTPVGVTTICPQCGVMLDALTTTCGACGAVITGAGSDVGRADKLRLKLQEAIGDALALGDMLGRGGMGIVFRAREKALDRDVALKVLAFDPLLNPDAYARFEREAKLAARLDHPNIVPIFSVGQRNGIAFYTMRMVKGGSVEAMITPGRGFDLGRAVAILRDVAAALDFAHANGVVHRDIKPANVLIGDSGHALVADFGIARAFGDAGNTAATGTGVVGSPAYMSPEQWRGEKVDGRADQYALAVLAFELLTGRRPFADASMQELLRMHLSEDPPDIISLRNDLGSHTTDAIWRAMAKNPEERFPNSTAFVHALAGGVAVPPVRLTPLGVPAVRPSSTVKIPTPAPSVARATAAGSRAVAAVQPPAPRSMWPVAGLLLLVGALGGVIVVQQRDAAKPAIPAAAVAIGPSFNADSIAAAERAQLAENAELRKEAADARRIALDAEHRLEQLSRDRPGGLVSPVKELERAHLFVMTRGGTPGVLVDGRPVADASPAVIEVTPGRHTVQVSGGGVQFFPAEYSVEMSANDTTNLTFVSKRVAQQNAFRARQRGAGNDGADASTPSTAVPPSSPAPSIAQGAGPTSAADPGTGRVNPAANAAAAPAGGAKSPDLSKMTPDQQKRWQTYLRNQALRQAQRRP